MNSSTKMIGLKHVDVKPSPGKTATGEELNRFAAEMNAETIREMHAETTKEIDSLQEEIRNLRNEMQIVTLERDILREVREKDLALLVENATAEISQRLDKRLEERDRAETALRTLREELENAVVTVSGGKRITLWALYELDEYEPLCRDCGDVKCAGCGPSNVVRFEFEAEG